MYWNILKMDENKKSKCCHLPAIPVKWILFFDFAFTIGTTIVYFADIVTDIITLKMYWEKGWHSAFGLSLGFIVGPSILLAILECQFLIKTYGNDIKWRTVLLRTLLNVPFQLTVIWYHFKLSYRYMLAWLNNRRSSNEDFTVPASMTSANRGKSMSNLADIDDRANTIERRAFMEVPVDATASTTAYPVNTGHWWWKQLTREEWLAHLNKMKLTESMLESLPQLLINVYLIVRYPNTAVVQYISATLSYLSLCGGIVRYDKTRKDNEAARLMVDRTLLHSRVFATRLEWPQILFLSLYKGAFLAARILVFVYFAVYFEVYILVFVFMHWVGLMAYLVYLWYPTDMDKKTRQLVQADYKFRAYMFLSQDFISVLLNSLVGIFINVRPRNYAFLGQPYCYLFWYYFIYVIENLVLFILPGVYFSFRDEEAKLLEMKYYVVMVSVLLLNVLGGILCVVYYFYVHKMHVYSRNAYPQFGKVNTILCCCFGDAKSPMPKEWSVCKQAETSEIFFLRKEKLKEFKSGFTTVVRSDRKRGRNLECFIDDHGKIFYAPRKKLFKKLPITKEEEDMVNLRKEESRESLDEVGIERSASHLTRPPESLSTMQNERLVGEKPIVRQPSSRKKPEEPSSSHASIHAMSDDSKSSVESNHRKFMHNKMSRESPQKKAPRRSSESSRVHSSPSNPKKSVESSSSGSFKSFPVHLQSPYYSSRKSKKERYPGPPESSGQKSHHGRTKDKKMKFSTQSTPQCLHHHGDDLQQDPDVEIKLVAVVPENSYHHSETKPYSDQQAKPDLHYKSNDMIDNSGSEVCKIQSWV